MTAHMYRCFYWFVVLYAHNIFEMILLAMVHFLFINSFLMCTNYDGYSIHAQNKRFISSHLCLYTWNKILPPLYFVSVSM